MKKHIILDTDIAGDPDDVFALFMALASPEITIDLIVTSDEHKGHRKSFAKEVLKYLHIDIPVVQGKDIGNDYLCMACDLVKESSKDDYISAIKKVVEKNEKTYYACIGPQSNIAEFTQKEPELMKKVELVMMGGAINYRKPDRAEHNIKLDVNAARIVFDSNINKRYVISDTTYNKKLMVDEDDELYSTVIDQKQPLKDLLKKSIDKFFYNMYPATYMHDPLTLAYLIAPEFIEFGEKELTMNERGMMKESSPGKTTIVSTNADYEGFMNFLQKRISDFNSK